MDSQTKTKAVNLEDLQISAREVFNKGFGNSGTCATAAATPAKEVTLGTIFSLVTGCTLLVKFTHGITSENSTLAVTHTVNGASVTETAKPIYLNGAALEARIIPAGAILILRYNGTQFDIIGGGGQASDAYTKAQTDSLLDSKVDKVTGKGLSTNDYTTNEKNKLAGIAEGAEVNVQSDWNATSGDAMILNKPTIPSEVTETTVSGWGFTKNAGTVTGIKMNGASKGTSGVVDLGTVITAHQDISGKVDKTTTVNGHALSGNVSVTKSDVGLGNVGNFKAVSTVASQGLSSTEKTNARANIGAGTSSFSGSYNDLSNKPTIPAAAANGTYTVKTLVGSTTTNVSDFTANQSSADDVTFVQGSNVTITPDATNRKITIAATDTTYSSKAAASGGTAVSLCTTGEKYAWNGKQAAASFTQVSGKTYYALTL